MWITFPVIILIAFPARKIPHYHTSLREQILLGLTFPALTAQVNPVPRTYVRGFGALPFGEVRNIHPEQTPPANLALVVRGSSQDSRPERSVVRGKHTSLTLYKGLTYYRKLWEERKMKGRIFFPRA